MSFTLKRGLSNVFVAEVTDDTAEVYTVGETFHLIPAGEMTRSVDSESTPVYYDNGVFYTSGREGGTEVSITGAAIRPADLAKLLGKTIDSVTGAVIDSGDYTEKYWALGAETENVDGTKELFWFLKGTFAAPEQSDKTKDDSTDTNGMELTYTAVRTNHQFTHNGKTEGVKRVVIDTETTVLNEDAVWTAQVVTPDNLSSIAKKKSA